MSDKVKFLNSLIALRDRVDALIEKIGKELINADPDINWDDEPEAPAEAEPEIRTPLKEYLPDQDAPVAIVTKKDAEQLEKNGLIKQPALNKYGKWSLKYSACIDCGSNMYKHKTGGRCTKCYSKFLSNQKNLAQESDPTLKHYECKNCGHLFYSGEDNPVCIECDNNTNFKII